MIDPAERRTYIGASESPVILGLSSWSTPLRLWAEKRGILEPSDTTEYMEWGNRLEQPIAAGWLDRVNKDREAEGLAPLSILPEQRLHRLTDHPHIACHPDFWVDDPAAGDALLEIKNVGLPQREHWEDAAPLHYQVQLQQQLLCTGLDRGYLCALIGGQTLVWHEYQRSEPFCSRLIAVLDRFWRRVIEDDPPTATGADNAILGQLLKPDDEREPIVLPGDASEWDTRRAEAMEHIAHWQAIKDDAEAKIKQAIGSATRGVLIGGGAYSWHLQKRKGYTVEPSECRVLRRLKG